MPNNNGKRWYKILPIGDCWHSVQISTPLTSGTTWWLMDYREEGKTVLLISTLLIDLKYKIKGDSFEHSLRSRFSAKTFTCLFPLSLISKSSRLSRIWLWAVSNDWLLIYGVKNLDLLPFWFIHGSNPWGSLQGAYQHCSSNLPPNTLSFCQIYLWFLIF